MEPGKTRAAAAPALLAFDTSTEVLAIAAMGPQGVSALNLPGGAVASAQLLPGVEAALAAAGLAHADLDAIAFGRGPGAFTGLRTSCAVAQGLGFGLGRPLLALDSLLVVAEDAMEPIAAGAAAAMCIAVAMDARMDEIYGAVYRHGGPTGWCVVRSPALYTLAAWNAVSEEAGHRVHCLAGSALTAFGPRLHRAAGRTERPTERDRARALLRLAERALASGEGVDAALALPLYLRDRVALTTAERQAAKAVAGSVGGGA